MVITSDRVVRQDTSDLFVTTDSSPDALAASSEFVPSDVRRTFSFFRLVKSDAREPKLRGERQRRTAESLSVIVILPFLWLIIIARRLVSTEKSRLASANYRYPHEGMGLSAGTTGLRTKIAECEPREIECAVSAYAALREHS